MINASTIKAKTLAAQQLKAEREKEARIYAEKVQNQRKQAEFDKGVPEALVKIENTIKVYAASGYTNVVVCIPDLHNDNIKSIEETLRKSGYQVRTCFCPSDKGGIDYPGSPAYNELEISWKN